MGNPQNDPIGGQQLAPAGQRPDDPAEASRPAGEVVTPEPVQGDEKAAILAELSAGRNEDNQPELVKLRAELEEFRADRARRERQAGRAQRGDADGVSPPLENGEERENTHTLYLANGKTVEAAGSATHYGTDDGVFPVTYSQELPRR